MQSTNRWVAYGELGTLFFLHGAAMSMWFVPLTSVLDAYGLHGIKPYAYATFGLAAFVSPLLFGAMADLHLGPVRVLRWVAAGVAISLALLSTAIDQHFDRWLVLSLTQVLTLFAAPTWSLTNTIVLAALANPSREFGPVRALGTLGWMAGCWVVSALNLDSSTLAGYCGCVTWLAVSCFTLLLPSVAPPKLPEPLSLRRLLGVDSLLLLKNRDHRAVFTTAALATIPLAAFYPYTPPHLRELGLERTAAWMTLGQVTEILAMLSLSTLLAKWRLKWIFVAGLVCALWRYIFCALNGKAWLLAGVSLHGFAFTLFFITAPIYLDSRVDPKWRARAQALMVLMTSGLGNLAGYLMSGWWFKACERPSGTQWPLFWGGLAGGVALVLAYFLITYRGETQASATISGKRG